MKTIIIEKIVSYRTKSRKFPRMNHILYSLDDVPQEETTLRMFLLNFFGDERIINIHGQSIDVNNLELNKFEGIEYIESNKFLPRYKKKLN